MKLNCQKILFVTLFWALFSCGSSGRYFIKKEFPDSLYSSAKSTKVIISATSIRKIDNKTRIVYRQWRFLEATRTHVMIAYEEFYESKKDTPDLTEEIKAPIEEDTITINNYRIRIFQLKEDYIAFYLERER